MPLSHKVIELIDWSERYPDASALEIATIQSTYCLCGQHKEIGAFICNSQCSLNKPTSDEKLMLEFMTRRRKLAAERNKDQ